MDDSYVEDSEEDDTFNLVLGGIFGHISPPNTLPHSKGFHPKAGVGLKEKEHSMTWDGDI